MEPVFRPRATGELASGGEKVSERGWRVVPLRVPLRLEFCFVSGATRYDCRSQVMRRLLWLCLVAFGLVSMMPLETQAGWLWSKRKAKEAPEASSAAHPKKATKSKSAKSAKAKKAPKAKSAGHMRRAPRA